VKGKNTTEVEERYGEGRFDGPDDPHDVDEQGDRVPF
jgi:hypothetical protein